mgnify:FL=1
MQSPLRHDFDILSGRKAQHFLTYARKISCEHIKYKAASNTYHNDFCAWESRCWTQDLKWKVQKIALESWISSTCDCATSKIPAYLESAPLKTPMSIKIEKGKILKFFGEIFAKTKNCQSCLLIPIWINTITIIVRDILIDTLLLD